MRQKNYIPILTMTGMEKRGQMTIFIIVVLMISAIILIFVFNNQIKTVIMGGNVFSPNAYLKECVEDELKEKIELVGKQGSYSSLKNVGKVAFNGDEYAYLCYTSQNYVPCVVQQPLIKRNFEKSLKELVGAKANECMGELKKEYERRGYTYTIGESDAVVEIMPSAVKIVFNAPVTASKGDVRQSFDKLESEIQSEVYDLVFISKSIVDYESTFGDSETTMYMQYYPDLIIEKTKLSDGTTIYKVSNAVSKEEFRFASRSLAWPPGYGG